MGMTNRGRDGGFCRTSALIENFSRPLKIDVMSNDVERVKPDPDDLESLEITHPAQAS